MISRANTVTGLVLVLLLCAASPLFGQPAPLDEKTGGALIGDMTLDHIYLTQDLNGDGDADDAGESWVYFDATNGSGLPNPTASVYSIFQSISGYQFFGDGGTDSVYRMRDLNGNWNALDAGEANVWFSAADNFYGFTLNAPNGIFQDSAGATYLLNAGTTSLPDALYRTVDLNLDGDANDENESTLWMDMQNLIPNSSAFGLTFLDDAAYISDLVGGDPDAVFRVRDVDGNGQIDAGEFNVFIDDTNPYGAQVGAGIVTDGINLYISESLTSVDPQKVTRLIDLNGSGDIDDASEVLEVWNEDLVPAGYFLGASWALAIGPGGELLVASSGTDENDNVFRLLDLTGDGDFLDHGETIVWASGHGSGVFVDNARSLEYIVPEPGSLCLLVVGALALVRRR
jgi:hypothetical protein